MIMRRTLEPGSGEEMENPLLPAFRVPYVRYLHRTRAPSIRRCLAGDIKFHNVDRLASIRNNGVRTFQAYGPHLSQIDYMVPHDSTYELGLNPLRVVTGMNLMRPLFRRSFQMATGVDLPEWGILLKDRDNSRDNLLKYIHAVEEALVDEKLSVGAWFEGGYEEGARDRGFRERGKIRDVPPSFYIPALRAQRKMDKPLKLLCIVPRYGKTPEDKYWDLIKSSRLGSHFWDAKAHWDWVNETKKDVARVNFSRPVDMMEIAGGGNVKSQLANLASYTHETVTCLYNEMAA